MALLVDASVFCAYANKDDVHHEKAANIIREILANKHGEAITTDYIFDETITVILRRTNKKTAIEAGNFILDSEVSIFEINKLIFQKAWEIFKTNGSFSFTDCATIAFAQTFGIDSIATFDKEFKKLKSVKIID